MYVNVTKDDFISQKGVKVKQKSEKKITTCISLCRFSFIKVIVIQSFDLCEQMDLISMVYCSK